MARTTENKGSQIEFRGDSENPVEEKDAGTSGVTISKGSKSVKIRMLEGVDSIISGEAYCFSKGKEASVPSDVAAILCNSKKAFRL